MLSTGMRRILAITLTLLFGFTLAAPLFALNALTDLPECCRRNGRHHCMIGMADGAVATGISTAVPRCPHFPKATLAPLPHSFTPATTRRVGPPLFVHPASSPQTEARYRISFARSRQKRGPPAAVAAS